MLRDLDLASELDAAARECPESPALVGASGRLTYAELHAAVLRAAAALAGLGVAAGERVALSLPNDVDLVIAFLATLRLGAIQVGVHRVLAPPEKRFALADCGARVCIADGEVARALEQLRGELPELRHVIELGAWRERAAASAPLAAAAPADPHAPAAIAYTSGTTGTPKGVVHSQHNVLLPGAVFARLGYARAHEPIGVMLPLTILNLMVLGPLTALSVRSKAVLIDRRDAPGIAEWIRRERVAIFNAVPTLVHDLLTHPDVDPAALASVTQPRIGGAGSPESFRELFRERFGTDLASSYALTEGPTLVTREHAGEPRIPGSLGRALPHVEVTIRDEGDRELAVGETGEICVGPRHEGPWAGVYRPMLGYWNRSDDSARALRGGRLHTGDLGRLDAEGRLYLVERRSELMIRGGSNIYPSEIERVLRLDPRVADCAVVPRPDARLGEGVIAFVEPAAGEPPDPETLLALCRANLARYKVPEEIRVLEALPRGPMGKVARAALRERAARD
jgi:acyl-CoA synthetase (AMP-forming)/AMP-acid ligase II